MSETTNETEQTDLLKTVEKVRTFTELLILSGKPKESPEMESNYYFAEAFLEGELKKLQKLIKN